MNMARHFPMLLLLTLGFTALAGSARAQSSAEGHGAIAVVVNTMNPLSDLALPELRKMLTGERRFWKGNVQVRLVLRAPGSPEHDRVIALLLHMDNASFSELWRAKVFRGEAADEPPKVASGNLAAEYVGRTSGGITFMAARSVPPGLKILSVDGKLPGQPGYALNKDSRQ